MSCAVPCLFMPFINKEACYIDGGIKHNFPINYCLKDHPNKDEVLGIKINYKTEDGKPLKPIVKPESSLLDFISAFTINAMLYIRETIRNENIKNQVICYFDNNPLNLDFFIEIFSNSELRRKLLETGEQDALDF